MTPKHSSGVSYLRYKPALMVVFLILDTSNPVLGVTTVKPCWRKKVKRIFQMMKFPSRLQEKNQR